MTKTIPVLPMIQPGLYHATSGRQGLSMPTPTRPRKTEAAKETGKTEESLSLGKKTFESMDLELTPIGSGVALERKSRTTTTTSPMLDVAQTAAIMDCPTSRPSSRLWNPSQSSRRNIQM
jgi:hypothetical protein